MKTKVARKAMRHAKPMRKRAHTKKPARANTARKTKATFREAVEPETIELTEATFAAPVAFVDTDPEPVNEVIEIFEVVEDDDQGGW
ncbi:MAG: hypothetical protein ABSA96_12475 [Candidatus Acidiferrales bacterium]|jgi:hypothetical protein